MIAIMRSVVLCGLLFAGTSALAGDPHAPQLNVSFLAQPAPIVQNGSTRLFYEMLITNFAKTAFVLDAVEAKAGDTQSKVSGATLAPLMIHLGAPAATDDLAARTIRVRPQRDDFPHARSRQSHRARRGRASRCMCSATKMTRTILCWRLCRS